MEAEKSTWYHWTEGQMCSRPGLYPVVKRRIRVPYWKLDPGYDHSFLGCDALQFDRWVPMFERNLVPSPTMKMEAAGSSEMLVMRYHITFTVSSMKISNPT
jgi:hypothetical protein